MYALIPLLAAALLPCLLPLAADMKKHERPKLPEALTALRRVLIVLLTAAILIRPMREVQDANIETRNIDVLFVVDETISMWAEDYDGNKPRMDGVLDFCRGVMDDLSGANFALIVFENRSRILAPFTQDAVTVGDAMNLITVPDTEYARGSTLNTPYADMERLLRSSAAKDKRITAVFFLSDGEITDNSQLMSFKDLAGMIDYGAVLGCGTAEGGIMKDSYGFTIRDRGTYDHAVSCLDENVLQQLAQDLNLPYVHLEKDTDLQYLEEAILAESAMVSGTQKAVSYKDLYYLFTVPLILLLLWEIIELFRGEDF